MNNIITSNITQNIMEDSDKIKVDIHEKLKKKLDYFIENHKIPHIIFYGNSGTGKKYVLNYFIKKIYKNDQIKIKEYVMYVNCAHCKGIRFIRDELKFFAKRNMQNNNGKIFKSIILLNAEKLTTDAQSALRRCIEQFSHNTRFFIVIENIDSLLNPILSRFCNIYIPYPKINNIQQNLYNITNNHEIILKKEHWLKNKLSKKNIFRNVKEITPFVEEIYDKGYSALDILNYIEKTNDKNKYKFLFYFDKIRREFRNEKQILFFIINFAIMRKKLSLENIYNL